MFLGLLCPYFLSSAFAVNLAIIYDSESDPSYEDELMNEINVSELLNQADPVVWESKPILSDDAGELR